jgi:hypothetical protein
MQQPITNQQLDKSQIPWKGYFTLDKASLGQIMKTFEQIKIVPKNKYETILSAELKIIIEDLIKSFDETLIYNNDVEKQVFQYNLLGQLPHGLSIDTEEHGKIKLKTANIGNLVKATCQRINFILTRETPLMYKDKEDYMNAFNKMKDNMNTFLQKVKTFETNFVKAVDKSHKSKKN